MLVGYGWCILRSSQEEYRNATVDEVYELDERIEAADKRLWQAFRDWMSTLEEPMLKWHFYEHLNNQTGILLFCISRNHRSSSIWEMLQWIATNGSGSYGLFFAHDDEDVIGTKYSRKIPEDYDNCFRVHRILNGTVTEMADPFFGLISPNIDPSSQPYDRNTGENPF
jgi:Immunity protein 7